MQHRQVLLLCLNDMTYRNEITACSMGTILDGTPRTSGQALFVKSLADSLGLQVLGADLTLDRDILIERLLGRRVCLLVNKTMHFSTVPCANARTICVP